MTMVIDGVEYKNYAQYLRSEHWQKLRANQLRKDHNRCNVCNSKENLRVHHLNYNNMDEPQLVTLCDSCHKKLHDVVYPALEKELKELADESKAIFEEASKMYNMRRCKIIKKHLEGLNNGQYANKGQCVRMVTRPGIKGLGYGLKIGIGGGLHTQVMGLTGSGQYKCDIYVDFE